MTIARGAQEELAPSMESVGTERGTERVEAFSVGVMAPRPADLELTGDFRAAEAFSGEPTDLGRIDGGLATRVNSGGLSLGNALDLTLLAEIGLELGEHA